MKQKTLTHTTPEKRQGMIPFVVTDPMKKLLESTVNDLQQDLLKVESIPDPFDRVIYIRKILGERGIGAKNDLEVCRDLLMYWLYARGQSADDLRDEVAGMIQLLQQFKRALPADTEQYQSRVNTLRERGWAWHEVAAKIIPNFDSSDPYWQRQLTKTLRKRNHKWNKEHDVILVKSTAKKKIRRLPHLTKK